MPLLFQNFASCMSVTRRLVCLLALGLMVLVFETSPEWLHLDTDGMIARAVVMQIGGPLLAALACLAAAIRSKGSDRQAWFSFAIGSGLYLAGNLTYLGYALTGIESRFPALPEAAYFVMAVFFAKGILLYGKVRQQISRVQVYNFVLIACAVMLASMFLLNRAVDKSVMPPFATGLAVFYPALWFSVAASGAISLLLYAQPGKTYAFGLLLAAMLAESVADFAYALQLLRGTYENGGLTQLLWVTSAGLIVLAGLEQRVFAGRPAAQPVRRPVHSVVEAAIPSIAIAIVLVSGSLTSALGNGTFALLAVVLALGFAGFSGLREYWIINTQKQLRSTVEAKSAALEKSQAQVESVLESTSDSVIVLDHDWLVVYFNHRAAEEIDNSAMLKPGVCLWDLFPAAETSGEAAHYRKAAATRQPVEFELFVEDRQIWLGIQAFPTPDGLSIFFHNITEQKQARDEVLHLAHHDPLTGLANRTMFYDRLHALAARRARFAVILIDVDHFKEVNDTLGHSVGDALLKATAERFRTGLGPDDLVARLGGDEFVIITENADASEATEMARRYAMAAGTPHEIEGESIRLGASIGIAISEGNGEDPDRLFRNADIALYAAKADARGAFRIFEPAMEAGLQDRQALRADLRAALGNGEFMLMYQPQVELRGEQVSGFEALIRWRHPTRGLIGPEVFIPIAEESGLIIAIGEWALSTACAEAMKWPTEVSLAVNLSTREFAGSDLASNVARALKESGLPAERLELEITESVLLKNSRANLETLRRLRALGLRIAIDDFGTGYSSLAYLQQFPFSKIKIDRSFISGLPESDASQAIVRSVIGLGIALGMRVTAEGVETESQYDWVRLGCNEVQGYFLSPPVAASEVMATMARLNARRDGERAEQARKAG